MGFSHREPFALPRKGSLSNLNYRVYNSFPVKSTLFRDFHLIDLLGDHALRPAQ